MISTESKDEMLAMVLTDLDAICERLAESPAVLEPLRATARDFVDEFHSFVPFCGNGTPDQHAQGEALLIRIARFLPRVTE